MSDGRGVLREIAWRELLPWLLLLRCFRLAVHPAILAIALVAATLSALGWNLAHRAIFWRPVPTAQQLAVEAAQPPTPPEALDIEDPDLRAAFLAAHKQRAQARHERETRAIQLSNLPGVGRTHDPNIPRRLARPFDALSTDSPIGYVFHRVSNPILQIYRPSTDLPSFAFYLLGTLWTLAVWGFGGGMITRLAAIELGREEQAGLRPAFRLTLRRWFDFFTAPLYPVLGTFLIALLSLPVGWLLLSNTGTIVAGLLWIFVLIGGALSALLLLWLFIGWPLMWPAISAEETGDSFEAMSRSFAYVFQRPLHYLFYAAVAALIGFIGWSLVDFGCQLALTAAHWSVSWGSGHERLQEVLSYPSPTTESATALSVGASMIRGIEGLLLAISEAFAYSFFWVSATAIYLLLRQDLDHAEFDEVWVEDNASRFGLPPEEPETTLPPLPTTPTATVPPPIIVDKATPPENNQAE